MHRHYAEDFGLNIRSYSLPQLFGIGALHVSSVSNMATPRSAIGLARRAAQLSRPASQWHQTQRRCLATVAPHPVTQDATGSKGPTAMVFMNMGGPQTTDEVGDFLSRLFVCIVTCPRRQSSAFFRTWSLTIYPTPGRRRPNTTRPTTKLPGPPHLPAQNPQDQETIR